MGVSLFNTLFGNHSKTDRKLFLLVAKEKWFVTETNRNMWDRKPFTLRRIVRQKKGDKHILFKKKNIRARS